MTYREYFNDHSTETLGWCSAYTTDAGDYTIIVNDGHAVTIKTPDGDVYYDKMSTELIESVARVINPDFDDYSGWNALHIALDVMHQIPCCECPYFEDCDAMTEEI